MRALVSIQLILVLCRAAIGHAEPITLAWTPCPSAEVVGYTVYYGPSPATYTNSVAVGNVTNVTLTSLVTGATYYLAATSRDANGK